MALIEHHKTVMHDTRHKQHITNYCCDALKAALKRVDDRHYPRTHFKPPLELRKGKLCVISNRGVAMPVKYCPFCGTEVTTNTEVHHGSD